jgi:polyferredoxin
MNKILCFVIVPLVLLYALLASFVSYDIWAFLISAVGTIIIMFMLGRLYQKQ